MAVRMTPGQFRQSNLVCTFGKTKRGETSFQVGFEGMPYPASHEAPTWARIFKKDKDGDLIFASLVEFIGQQLKGTEGHQEFVQGLADVKAYLDKLFTPAPSQPPPQPVPQPVTQAIHTNGTHSPF